jgi:hypothetical protein
LCIGKVKRDKKELRRKCGGAGGVGGRKGGGVEEKVENRQKEWSRTVRQEQFIYVYKSVGMCERSRSLEFQERERGEGGERERERVMKGE